MAGDVLDDLDQSETEAPTSAEPVAQVTEAPEPEAPAPAADPTPTEAVATPPPAPAKEPDRTVPLAAFLEQRNRYEQQIKALESKQGKEAPPPPAADPDFVADPKGYVDARTQKALSELETLRKQGGERIDQALSEVNELKLTSAIAAAEAQAATETPDYLDALNHVRSVRMQQLQFLNPGATQEQLLAHIGNEERAMAASDLAAGRNPYRTIYHVAKTVGYTPTAAKPAAPSALSAPEKANGMKPALSPETTLSKTGGSSPDTVDPTDDGEDDILSVAFSERFGRKRA